MAFGELIVKGAPVRLNLLMAMLLVKMLTCHTRVGLESLEFRV